MKTLLFGLTGLGNYAIDALEKTGSEIMGLVTRSEKGTHPYFSIENISRYAERRGIKVFEDVDLKKDKRVKEIISKVDLILVSTYDKILPRRIFSKPQYAINIHPGLLPKYKGRNPFADVLKNKEKETGLVAHLITERPDEGKILMQQKIAINDGETESGLRKLLAETSEGFIISLINQLNVEKSLK